MDGIRINGINGEAFNAPFTGCFAGDKKRLEKLKAVNENETPCETVIGVLAEAFAAELFEAYTGGGQSDGEAYFVYAALADLWNRDEIRAMYLYIAYCQEIRAAEIPAPLVWISKRGDLLKIYMKYFFEAFERQIARFGDGDEYEDADEITDENTDGN